MTERWHLLDVAQLEQSGVAAVFKRRLVNDVAIDNTGDAPVLDPAAELMRSHGLELQQAHRKVGDCFRALDWRPLLPTDLEARRHRKAASVAGHVIRTCDAGRAGQAPRRLCCTGPVWYRLACEEASNERCL